jgi:hypothetical protein
LRQRGWPLHTVLFSPAMNKRMAKRTARRARSSRRQRKQRGGDGWTYDAVAGVSASGAPFEARTQYTHCYDDPRAAFAPAVSPAGAMRGGVRRSRKQQRGGGCGCLAAPPMQAGGGSGTGGYAVDVGSNDLGKVYADLPKGPCPVAVPQRGGAGAATDADIYGISSYSAGYGFGPSGVMSTDSAHYLDPLGYDKTCQGGARKTRRARKGRKAHKHHKKAKKVRRTRRHHSRK